MNIEKLNEIKTVLTIFIFIFIILGLINALFVLDNLANPASWLEPNCVGTCRNLSNGLERSDLPKLAMLILTGILSLLLFISSIFLSIAYYIIHKINIDNLDS